MSAFAGIDYCETLFIHKKLTPIVGEPTYDTLELLLKELKANAQSVHSNLGGGAHDTLASSLALQVTP